MKQVMMGWQLHPIDHMQIICTSLQTDNHASTSPLNFYRLDALPDAQLTVSKHRRHCRKQFSKSHHTQMLVSGHFSDERRYAGVWIFFLGLFRKKESLWINDPGSYKVCALSVTQPTASKH